MDTFNDTDIDFWRNLENPDPTPYIPKSQKPLEEKIKKYKSSNPSKKDYLEKLLNQVRDAAKQKYRDKLSLSLHKQAKVFQKKIEEIKQSHLEEINDLLKKFWKLDETLIDRDGHINTLSRYFVQQEYKLTSTRIKALTEIASKNIILPYKETVDKDIYDSQISTYKELIGVYENDINILKKTIEELESRISDAGRRHELELFEMNKKIEKAQNDCKKKIRDVNQKYLTFKNDVDTEFHLKDTIIKRQGENLSRLKDELTLAKMVLDTPRLLFKYNEREPYRGKHSQSLMAKPMKHNIYSKSVLKHRKFDSNETLISTRATPIFTITPEPDHSAALLPTLSESDYYRD